MEIQAVWENGVLRPTRPLSLRHAVVTIQVPDEEIADAVPVCTLPQVPAPDMSQVPDDVRALIQQLRQKRAAIMAQPLPDSELTAEQQEGWEAFELRNALRREQGRPA